MTDNSLCSDKQLNVLICNNKTVFYGNPDNTNTLLTCPLDVCMFVPEKICTLPICLKRTRRTCLSIRQTFIFRRAEFSSKSAIDHLHDRVACVAGGISVGVLYCFGGGAARRVGIQVLRACETR